MNRTRSFFSIVACLFVLLPQLLVCQELPSNPESALQALENMRVVGPPNLTTQALALSGMALLPFLVMLLTSFVKMVVVLSLLRNALGAQQAPPNQVINGIALILSLYVMFPTALKMYESAEDVLTRYDSPVSLVSKESAAWIIEVSRYAREPLREFIKKNSATQHHAMFYKLTYKMLPERFKDDLKIDDFVVLVPAYITSQLKDAFEIGVLIYIPFFVIDLVTANILLAMGMMMLSPVTISMPLKLFLLVMLDGWSLLINGLVSTYQ